MAWLFLVFLSSTLYTGFLWPALQDNSRLISILICLVMLTLLMSILLKNKKIRIPHMIGAILFFIAGIFTGSRLTNSIPIHPTLDQDNSYFTNMTVEVTGFPDAIPPRSESKEVQYRISIVKGINILSSEIALLHPGQTVSLYGRYYQSIFQNRKYATLYVSAAPDTNTLALPPALGSQISTLKLEYPANIQLIEDKWPGLILISRIRVRASQNILRQSDPRIQALLFSMIMGNKYWLDYSTKESFRRGGISHILALSGLHIGILSICLIFLFSLFLSRRWTYALTSLLILFFVVFTGMSPSILRAGFMFVSYTGLKAVGYDPDWLDLLSFTAFFSLLINPDFLTNIGFLLSYSATLGIVLFSPLIKAQMERFRLPSFLSLPLSISLTATLSTLPLIITFFGGISAVSLITNLLLIPLFFLLIPALFLLFLLNSIGLTAGMLSSTISLLWRFIFKISDILTRPHWAYQEITPPHKAWAVVIYSVLILTIFLLAKRRFRNHMSSFNKSIKD